MKKSRAPNFTNEEIMHLLNLVEKYPIIQNKRTDGATTKEKQTAWQNLANEYNSQTRFFPRSADKLLSCYKNQKIRLKKMHSNENMLIKALNAEEKHGQYWDQAAQATDKSILDCQKSFEHSVKEEEEDTLHKKEIYCTGGDPPLTQCSDDSIFNKVKSLNGSSLEGLYTIYDRDADFMKEQHESNESPLLPVEVVYNIDEIPSHSNNSCTPDQKIDRREDLCANDLRKLNVRKRKVDSNLGTLKTGKKKLICHSFQELAEDKKTLVKAQKTLAEYQIEHQKLLIDLAKEKLEFEKTKNEMELTFLKQKFELELELLRNKSKCD